MTPITRLNKITGESSGSVTCQNFAHAPAPSISAASNSDLGMSCNPAKKISVDAPMPHRLMRMSPGLDQFGSANQAGAGIPTVRRNVLINPDTGSNSTTNTSVAATGGTTDGK